MSSNNQPQVALDFDLETGECITVAMSLAKNALPYTIERLRACGWAGKNILDLRGVDDQFVTVDVFVKKNPNTGREALTAEIVTGGSASTFKLKTPIPAAKLDAFAAYVTRGIEAMPPPKASALTGELDEPKAGANDEIPF
jgi:hypothetical protein